jgi:hypothetical protein
MLDIYLFFKKFIYGDDNKGENAAAASGPEKPISYK